MRSPTRLATCWSTQVKWTIKIKTARKSMMVYGVQGNCGRRRSTKVNEGQQKLMIASKSQESTDLNTTEVNHGQRWSKGSTIANKYHHESAVHISSVEHESKRINKTVFSPSLHSVLTGYVLSRPSHLYTSRPCPLFLSYSISSPPPLFLYLHRVS